MWSIFSSQLPPLPPLSNLKFPLLCSGVVGHCYRSVSYYWVCDLACVAKRWACMCDASGLICDGSCKYWTGLLPPFCICLSTTPCFRTALIVLGPLTLALFSWSTANAPAPAWVNVCPCPPQSSQYVQCVAGCLQLMLRVNEYRFAWVEADGVNWWVSFGSLESMLKKLLQMTFMYYLFLWIYFLICTQKNEPLRLFIIKYLHSFYLSYSVQRNSYHQANSM